MVCTDPSLALSEVLQEVVDPFKQWGWVQIIRALGTQPSEGVNGFPETPVGSHESELL